MHPCVRHLSLHYRIEESWCRSSGGHSPAFSISAYSVPLHVFHPHYQSPLTGIQSVA